MYPRNSASPPRIAVGAVVQISDGAVQTSGVSVVVRPEGGSESAGGGTIAYSAASGIVYYTPTQAETDYTAFVVIAYKTACIPVSQTIVTTASATAGKVVLSGETHTSAVIPTVSTLTGHTAQTGDAYARLGAPAGASVSADIATVAGYLDTEIAALATAVADLPTNSELATALAAADDAVLAAIAALNNLSAAEVNAQVVDALATDTYAELGSAPAATVSLATKIGWLFMLARNKQTQTATTTALRNDADTADIATSTVSDDGTTATVGEWA